MSHDPVPPAPSERERQFDRLVGPLVEAAYGLALTMLRDPTEAEDAVQEAALKAWRRLDTLRDGTAVRPWFFAIVANQCRSVRRGRWWSVLRVADAPAGAGGVEEAAAQGTDLRRALARLGADERLALYLYFFEDLPMEEVAAAMGVSEPAARSRVYRAVKRLRPGLELREVVP